jgi:hypothetical protein
MLRGTSTRNASMARVSTCHSGHRRLSLGSIYGLSIFALSGGSSCRHGCRAGGATQTEEAGVDIRVISNLLKHTQKRTRDRQALTTSGSYAACVRHQKQGRNVVKRLALLLAALLPPRPVSLLPSHPLVVIASQSPERYSTVLL